MLERPLSVLSIGRSLRMPTPFTLSSLIEKLRSRIRRNVATISQEERNRLRDAFIELNRRFYPGNRDDRPTPGGVSHWFKQDEIHQATHVHGGPAFLPWHRELCNRFEAMLREIDPNLSLHYWDWTTDPRWMFTEEFMGSANGEVGRPLLDAGFYNPSADPHRDSRPPPGTPPNTNPFAAYPPRSITRGNISSPPPISRANDDRIINAGTYHAMRNPTFRSGGLEDIHNTIHEYIGGTIGDPHASFRDPFVFLLHSNVDRLFAMWQLQPGQEWRLDPNRVYGDESDTVAIGREVGILTPIQPWAGVGAPGSEEGVIATRPWAPPENEQRLEKNRKNSKHPSIVNPPQYDSMALT